MGPKPTLALSTILCNHLCRLLLGGGWRHVWGYGYFYFPCPDSTTLPFPRVYFALPACPGPKYTLGRASEMTPEGWCTVFSAACILWEASLAYCFHRKSPKSPKSAQNRGTPQFTPPPFLTTFSGSSRIVGPPCHRISTKSAGFPPVGSS